MEVPRVYIDGIGWRRVDRLALEIKLGRPIRPGFDAMHTCGESTCVNPDHLFEGRITEKDKELKKRRQ